MPECQAYTRTRVALAGVLGLDTCRHRYRCHCQCLHGNRLIPTHPTDRPARTYMYGSISRHVPRTTTDSKQCKQSTLVRKVRHNRMSGFFANGGPKPGRGQSQLAEIAAFKGTPSIPETYLSSSVARGLNLRVG